MSASHLITPGVREFPHFLKTIETKWKLKLLQRFERERFAARKAANKPDLNKPPRYILSMFPYPSGKLHLGHVRIYTSGDILARYSRLLVKNDRYNADYDHVIYPMGFDSFGLPAENAARERGLNPAVWTNSNIRTMKQQLDDLGLLFDWREATSNPSFYKWTQMLFLKLVDAGLVYKSFAQVNWDPVDKTVLADEQVDEEGRSWRSGALVEKRYYRQWFIKVNAFTNAIYGADEVDPETWRDVLAIQRHWVGEPSGWIFYLPFDNSDGLANILPIFTKHPELFHDSSSELVISSDHWLNKVYRLNDDFHLRNPFTGSTLKITVTENTDDLPPNTKATISPGDHGSHENHLAREQILLQAKLNKLGGYYTSDKYRDWLVSRQRFWGTPIPAGNCESCGYFGVPKESLPIKLPEVSNLSETTLREEGTPEDDEQQVTVPIEQVAPRDWIETECPSCGSKAKRECETFDTLFDSSWYFLRYASEPTRDESFDRDKVQPVWCYIGGKEHAAMHLFYARFVTHFLHSMGELKFREPFKSLLVQGVVKSRTYKLNGRYLSNSEVESLPNKKKLVIEYEKMSKSKGNGVDPQELIDTYGVDATRFCLMSYANPRTERLWRSNEEEFREVISYLRRVVLTVEDYVNVGKALLQAKNQRGTKVIELNKNDLQDKKRLLIDARNRCSVDAMFNLQESNQFRQYISALHILTSAIRNNVNNSSVYTKEFAEALASLIVFMNPIVPHLTEELWLHFSQSIINPLRQDQSSTFKINLQVSDQPWPLPDHDYGRSHCFKKPIDLDADEC